ncbi:MAG: fibronectin type III domain-containing protein [Bacteroidota bacterium]
MKKKLTILTVLLMSSILGIAQQASFKLYGERSDSTISLAWIPEHWPDGMEGVVIKRKVNQSAWELLTPEVVIPASFVGKDLSNVEPSPSEQARLNNKLKEKIDNQKAKPVSHEEYLNEILPDKTKYASIAFIFAIDYDLMLLNGLGCIDRNTNKTDQYEYGIFPVINGRIANSPVATFTSSAGANFNPELNMKPHAEVIGANIKIRLHWEFDLNEFQKKQIKGFNIYQVSKEEARIKLNMNVIWITSKNDPADLNYLVEFPEEKTSFLSVPVSYFGTEGEPREIVFDPVVYTIKVPPPKLSCAISARSAKLNWQIEHQYDSLISEFIVERHSPEGMVELTKRDSKSREYKYQVEELGRYYKFRVTAQTVTGKKIWSNECMVQAIDETNVQSPGNLKGEVIKKEDQYFIQLTWDYNAPVADKEFRIYTDGPGNELIYDSSLPKEITSPYLIEVVRSRSEKSHFAVLARNSARENSNLSNEIEVITPTRKLPPISITSISSGEKIVNLEWRFSRDVLDLKGFRILVDDKVMLTEDKISSGQRAIKLENISEGKHTVEIIAVTDFDIEEQSTPQFITVK